MRGAGCLKKESTPLSMISALVSGRSRRGSAQSVDRTAHSGGVAESHHDDQPRHLPPFFPAQPAGQSPIEDNQLPLSFVVEQIAGMRIGVKYGAFLAGKYGVGDERLDDLRCHPTPARVDCGETHP